jgi:hypothetical protein
MHDRQTFELGPSLLDIIRHERGGVLRADADDVDSVRLADIGAEHHRELHTIEKIKALIVAASDLASIAPAEGCDRSLKQRHQPRFEVPRDAVQIVSQHGTNGEAFCGAAIARKVG